MKTATSIISIWSILRSSATQFLVIGDTFSFIISDACSDLIGLFVVWPRTPITKMSFSYYRADHLNTFFLNFGYLPYSIQVSKVEEKSINVLEISFETFWPLQEATKHLSFEERKAIFRENAINYYGLDEEWKRIFLVLTLTIILIALNKPKLHGYYPHPPRKIRHSSGSVKMSDVLISLDFSTAYVDVEKLNAGGHFLFAKWRVIVKTAI